MSVLDTIIKGVLEDANDRKISDGRLMEMIAAAPAPKNFLENLGNRAVIAEIKRSSPSKGNLAEIPDPVSLAKIYEASGASAISVLTERRRFGGSLTDLQAVRSEINLPILRKDFLANEYLVRESRAFGADLALLIVAALDNAQLKAFYELVIELGMTPLIEVHSEEELERALQLGPKLIGVNARNLKTLEVDSTLFQRLLPLIPKEVVKVAESGISDAGEASSAFNSGADVILVGEALVKSSEPGKTLARFLTGATE